MPVYISTFNIPSDLLRPSMVIELIELIEDLSYPPEYLTLLSQLETLLVDLIGKPSKPRTRENS